MENLGRYTKGGAFATPLLWLLQRSCFTLSELVSSLFHIKMLYWFKIHDNSISFRFNITLVNLTLLFFSKSLSMYLTHSSKQQTQGRERIQKPKRISKISILPYFHSILFPIAHFHIFTVHFSTAHFHIFTVHFLGFSYGILQIFTVYSS